MAVKIAKLFKDYKFQELSQTARLLYIYLTTNPNLSTVGVFSPDIRVVALEVGITKEELRKATSELIDAGYIYVKKFDELIYFIVPAHFGTIPSSDATARRVTKLLSQLPDDFVKFLESINITPHIKVVEFNKPTAEEVTQYAMSIGFKIDGKAFVEYYDEVSGGKDYWVDGRNKRIKDWKSKLKKVWCKPDRELKKMFDAPKGYEYFHVMKDDVAYYPDGWRNGKPWSKSLTIDILLKLEYENSKRMV